jgi:hypothetical protein
VSSNLAGGTSLSFAVIRISQQIAAFTFITVSAENCHHTEPKLRGLSPHGLELRIGYPGTQKTLIDLGRVASTCHDPASAIMAAFMETESPPARRGGRNGNIVPPAPKGNRRAETHGLTTLRDAATSLNSRAIDGRSSLSYQLKKWRA